MRLLRPVLNQWLGNLRLRMICMRNSLGWLETRLSQNALNYMVMYYDILPI